MIVETKKYQISFEDKRRLQRTMIAKDEQEVIDYIKNKYKTDKFKVWEGER